MSPEKFFDILLDSNYWGDLIWNDMLFLPKRKIVFLSCSKNASSKIKLELYKIENGVYPPEQFSPHNRRAMGFQSPLDIGRKKFFKHIFDPEVTKFTVLRDPWSRIVSCYNSRVSDYLMEQYDSINYARNEWIVNRQKIIEATKGTRHSELGVITQEITFDQFIGFVISQNDYEMDRHWYHQYKAVFVDHIPFDIIGTVEHLNASLQRLAEKVGDNNYKFDGKMLNSSRSSLHNLAVSESVKNKYLEKFFRDVELYKSVVREF
ncbi:hypothetical protein NBRC116589_27580 [Ruegeria sp. HU-ET01832]|uniref:sulfotransferase family 2 domain-containing protein n=1 Tax=Ruegeria sp. HU-ET01832 TaxID=3135906 RepID=UPI00147A48B5